MKLSDLFPIYSITKEGVVISDTKAHISVCFKMSTPVLFTKSVEEYQNLMDSFKKFIENLGEEILVHKQDFYYRDLYSYVSDNSPKTPTEEFFERAYITHFNERPYLKMESFLYITKTGNTAKIGVSKAYTKQSGEELIKSVIGSSEILKNVGITLEFIPFDKLISEGNIFSRYLNFDKNVIEQIKDIDFSDNKVFVGGNEVKIYSIESEKQLPVGNVNSCKLYNGLPVSNMFDFSYKLSVPHVVNQYIYIPSSNEMKMVLDKRLSSLNSFNYKGSNDQSIEEISILNSRVGNFGGQYAYWHYNIMAFDAPIEEIQKEVLKAFSDSGFKPKISSLTRKDLFLSAFPTNGSRLIQEKTRLMCLMTDTEAVTLMNLEQNYQEKDVSVVGTRLCDRIYGIPFSVDIFDEPKKKNMIKNQNTVVLAGSGGGKSFTTNLILQTDYHQGAHVFCIDASFSYRLPCAMHNGVYLTFDDNNKNCAVF